MIGFLLGLLTGWVLFKQPDKVKEIIDKATAKVKEWTSKETPSE